MNGKPECIFILCLHRGHSTLLNSLKINIGIVPAVTAINGTSAILGITDSSIKTIAKIPNPSQDIVATNRNLFTYTPGSIVI
jgi:hypothetical protein